MALLVSFDCYGTLVDWLYGIKGLLDHLVGEGALKEFFDCERRELGPYKPYSSILRTCLKEVLKSHGISYSEEYGRAIVTLFARSPPFPDTIPGLLKLRRKGYRIAIISNTEKKLIEITLKGYEDLVDYVVTAEDIGYYKPDPRAFEKALELLGVGRENIVHVSAYPFYDLEPASGLGIRTVMVDRYGYSWKPKVGSIEELAEKIDKLGSL